MGRQQLFLRLIIVTDRALAEWQKSSSSSSQHCKLSFLIPPSQKSNQNWEMVKLPKANLANE